MGLEIGSIWNGWMVDSFIGEGSFGKVYRMTKTEFGYTYESALKVIRIPHSEDEVKSVRDTGMDEQSVTDYFKEMVSQIVSELRVMSELKGNTNIVGYEDHSVIELEDEFGWEIYLRMEMLTPLMTYMRTRDFIAADAARLGIDICRALEICRRHNIIHRDIKPDNIFVSRQGDFKLGDFGIARELEKTSAEMSKKGTVSYMAPEVYKGQPYDATVDTYSLGIVLYRLLNHNRLPFLPPYPEQIQYSDTQAALNKRLNGEPMPYPANAGDELAAVVLKACAFDPADRYRSPSELREALETLDRDALEPKTSSEVPAPAEETDLEETVGMFDAPAEEETVGMFDAPADAEETSEVTVDMPAAAMPAAPETAGLPDTGSRTMEDYPASLAREEDLSEREHVNVVYASPGGFGGGGGGRRLPARLIAIIAVAAIALIAVLALALGGRGEITGYDIQYNGERAAGIEINKDSSFTIQAKYSSGKTEEITDWEIVREWTLVEGDNTVYIKIGDRTYEYEINVPVSSDAGEADNEDVTETSAKQEGSGFDVIFKNGEFVADADTVMKTIAQTLRGYPYEFDSVDVRDCEGSLSGDGDGYIFRISNDHGCTVTIYPWINGSGVSNPGEIPNDVILRIENAKDADWPYDEIISWTRCIMWALDSGADIDWDEAGGELREDMDALRESTEVEGHSVSNQMCLPGDGSVVIVLKEDISPDDYNVMELHFEE